MLTILDPIQHVAYPDSEGKVQLNLDTSLSTLQVRIEAKCYHPLEKKLQIPLVLKSQTLELERYCFDANKVGILICDLVNSMGEVDRETAYWAQEIKVRLEEKQKKDKTLADIMQVNRWRK